MLRPRRAGQVSRMGGGWHPVDLPEAATTRRPVRDGTERHQPSARVRVHTEVLVLAGLGSFPAPWQRRQAR